MTAFAAALTNVCAYCWPAGDAPTLTVIVVAVTASTARTWSYAVALPGSG